MCVKYASIVKFVTLVRFVIKEKENYKLNKEKCINCVTCMTNVLPQYGKSDIDEAKRIHQILINEGFTVEYDESGSIGRRYARADEVGIPLSITIDYQTLKDNTVTIRDRDSRKQVRNNVERLPELFRAFFCYKLDFDDLGHLFKV